MEQVAEKATADGLFNKAVRVAVDTDKGALGSLKGYLDDLKDIGGGSQSNR
ncbi:Variable major outer membrane lipoprotein (plasmid) [Borrelia coriaceae ATCC 43381]|uniref:Variable major outer membrane lipoprotein n=1 Tax=Borrelia coriaceae ATCC 43381 TaxID=1408429 RepID=W5SWV8_9SPIR|nr:hypothetical protein [Borrelia coriaceae]AHH11689.1 Variable major outer membrane lipoprotein [Borrelia coriaceae ATCC 43381]